MNDKPRRRDEFVCRLDGAHLGFLRPAMYTCRFHYRLRRDAESVDGDNRQTE